MMLNIFPSSMEKRYAIAGSTIGALTSLACLSAGLPTGHGFLSFFDSLANSPLLNGAIVASSIGFGYLAARAGRRLDETERLLSAERSGVIELYHLAYHDALTGLGNRHALRRDTTTLVGTAEAKASLAALILIDLDGFKEINDTLGHDAGDAVLMTLAKRLRGACDFDCRGYRLGGDEFVILAEGAHDPADVEGFVQLLKSKVFKPVTHAGTVIETSGSIGISFLHGGEDTLSAALKRADLALYRAKERGDAGHAFHVGPTETRESAPHGAQRILRRAIEEGQLGVEYRPIWQSGNLKPRGFSAELLWVGCEAGAKDRSDGLEIAMEEWLLETVVRDMADWPAHLCVSLSLSLRTISRKGFANRLGERIAQLDLCPERFVLDVDFGAVRRTTGCGAEDNIAALRAMGVRIASADLVAGTFDIARAANSPVDCWRIDAARLRRTATARTGNQVVDAVANFAAAVGFELWFEASSDEDLAFAALFPNASVSGWPSDAALTAFQAAGYAARSEHPGRRLRVVS
jgi:diguanylate cyclase (GGDEF)-like protein